MGTEQNSYTYKSGKVQMIVENPSTTSLFAGGIITKANRAELTNENFFVEPIVNANDIKIDARAGDKKINNFADVLQCITDNHDNIVGKRTENNGEVFNNCTIAYELAHAEGNNTYAIGGASHAEGSSCVSYEWGSHAEGLQTFAGGSPSHAEGEKTSAYKPSSHSEGSHTIANGNASHAEGMYTYTYGHATHAEGSHTYAFGNYSHTEGFSTKTKRNRYLNTITVEWYNGFAEFSWIPEENSWIYDNGEIKYFATQIINNENNLINITPTNFSDDFFNNYVNYKLHILFNDYENVIDKKINNINGYIRGDYSHAQGYYTETTNNCEHAQGKYNKSNSGTISSIGIGTKNNDRKNAVEVLNDGNVFIKNINNYDGTNPSSEFSLQKAINSIPGKKNKLQNSEVFNDYIHNIANGNYSHAEGYNTIINMTASYSHAEGFNTITTNKAEHAEGKFNLSNDNTISSIGIGTENNDRKNAVEVLNNGLVYINGVGEYDGKNLNNAKSLQESINVSFVGEKTKEDGEIFNDYVNNIAVTNAHAEGQDTHAKGYTSHTEGTETTTNGDFSHAEGSNTVTTNEAEHAEGKYNVSHEGTISSIGIGNTDIGNQNAVEVLNNGLVYINGIGEYKGTDLENTKSLQEVIESKSNIGKETAEGGEIFNDYTNNIASNSFAHAEGQDTHAKGLASHTEGLETTANGNYSHVEGSNTVTNNEAEHTEGKYNVSHTGQTISSIGIGDDAKGNQNAVEVLNNGLVYINGIGNYEGTNLESTKSLQDIVNSKVDATSLNDYINKTDYANGTTYGIVKSSNDITVNKGIMTVNHANKATTATNADNANKATTATNATKADKADNATNAENAANADNAKNLNNISADKYQLIEKSAGIKDNNNNIILNNAENNIINGVNCTINAINSYILGRRNFVNGKEVCTYGEYNMISGSGDIYYNTRNGEYICGFSDTSETMIELKSEAKGYYPSHVKGIIYNNIIYWPYKIEFIMDHYKLYFDKIDNFTTDNDIILFTHAVDGNNNTVEGMNNMVAGEYSHAEGWITKVMPNITAAHAEGNGTIVNGNAAHAEGYMTKAYAEASHAEGFNTCAYGIRSHAEGHGTYAKGFASHAEGNTTYAFGNYSHAEGYQTYANYTGEHAAGMYNTSNMLHDNNINYYCHTINSVGVGHGPTNKINAVEILKSTGPVYNKNVNGNIYAYGIGNYKGQIVPIWGNNYEEYFNKIYSLQEIIIEMQKIINSMISKLNNSNIASIVIGGENSYLKCINDGQDLKESNSHKKTIINNDSTSEDLNNKDNVVPLSEDLNNKDNVVPASEENTNV